MLGVGRVSSRLMSDDEEQIRDFILLSAGDKGCRRVCLVRG